MLEERLKALELEELQRQIAEDTTADEECQRLDDQVRESLKAREVLAKQINTRRRLKKVQNELEVAKLVTSLLKQDTHDVSKSGIQFNITSNLPEAPPSQQRAATSDIFISSDQEMQGHSTPQPVCLTSEASVLPPPAPYVLPTTALATEASISAPDFTPEVRHPNVVTWPSPPLAAAQPISEARTALTYPAPIYPATVTVQPTPPVTTVTHHQIPAVSVPPSIASPPDPVTLGGSVHPKPYQVLYPHTQMAFSATHPVPSHGFPAQTTMYIPQAQPPGIEMLAASAYGVPKPVMPTFESGRESDFALLKMALDNLMNHQQHLSEQYKYQVLLGHLKLPSALQL